MSGRPADPVAGRDRGWARAQAYRAAGMCLWLNRGRVRNRAGRVLYVDRADRRARQLLLRRGEADRVAVRLWRAAVEAVRPTVVLDVGANYGEVVLSTSYPPGCRVLCVEADRGVAEHLARSLAAGLPGSWLTVAAACDRTGSRFVLQPGATSGQGRAVPAGPDAPADAVLRGVTCDDVVGPVDGGRLVFKVDVEGSEAEVLAGMAATLRTVSAACGIVEFYHLPRDSQRDLLDRHETYAVSADARGLLRLTGQTLPVIFPARYQVRPGYAKDVIVVAGSALALLTGTGPTAGAAGGR